MPLGLAKDAGCPRGVDSPNSEAVCMRVTLLDCHYSVPGTPKSQRGLVGPWWALVNLRAPVPGEGPQEEPA